MKILNPTYLVQPNINSLDDFIQITSDFTSGDIWVTPSLGFKKKEIGPKIIFDHTAPYIKFSAYEREGSEISRVIKYREIFNASSYESLEFEPFRVIPTLAERLERLNSALSDSKLSLFIHGKNLKSVLDLDTKDSKVRKSIPLVLDELNNFTYGSLKKFEEFSTSSEMYFFLDN